MPSMPNKPRLSAREIAVFGVCAGIMFALKKVMEPLPNIHPVAVMITVLTICYRFQALYPLYTYVLLEGLFGGFGAWWVPYLYVWTVLWGAVMLLPKKLPPKAAPFIYGAVCGLHGLSFGLLYAPVNALLMGFTGKRMLAWIVSGLPYDAIHGASNLVLGTVLCVPLIAVVRRAGGLSPEVPKTPKQSD